MLEKRDDKGRGQQYEKRAFYELQDFLGKKYNCPPTRLHTCSYTHVRYDSET